MKKAKKQWEPETSKGFTNRMENKRLSVDCSFKRVINSWGLENQAIPIRVIREKDYQRLLRMARGK